MWCFVLAHQEKGLGGIAARLQPFERFFGNDVSAVTWNLDVSLSFDELWIVITPLAGKDAPVIEALWLGNEVPFADDGCLIT